MIKIIIDGYYGKRVTYSMSDDAFIEVYTVKTIDEQNKTTLTNVNIEALDSEGVEITEEEI